MNTFVLKYGVHEIIEGENLIEGEDVEGRKEGGQRFLAHRYYNALLELSINSRNRFREIRAKYVPGLNEAEKQEAEAKEHIKEFRANAKLVRREARKKLQLSEEDQAKLKALKEEQKALTEKVIPLREQWGELVEEADIEWETRTTGAPRQLIEQIKEVGKQLKEAKKKKNNPDVDKLATTLKDLKKRRNDISPKTHAKRKLVDRVYAEMMEENWPQAWKDSKQNNREEHAQALKMREESGLNHGTYIAVENSVEQAMKMAKGADPKYKPWEFGGRKVGIQIQGGVLAKDAILGKSKKLAIWDQDIPRGARDPKKHHERMKGSNRDRYRFCTARVMLRKNEYVTVNFLMHRPMPDDAKILWVYLVPRVKGDRITWTIQFTVSMDRPMIQRAFGEGVAYVRLCWSKCDDGIISATVNEKPVLVSNVVIRKLVAADDVRAAQSVLFEGKKGDRKGAREMVADWMDANKSPSWLVEMTAPIPKTEKRRGRAGLRKWKKHGLLRAVAKRWVQETSELIGPPMEGERVFIVRRRSLPGRMVRERKTIQPRTRLDELWLLWRQDRDDVSEEFGRDRGDYFTLSREPLDHWLESQGIHDEWTKMGVWLDWWRRKDEHLDILARDFRSKGINRRKEERRAWASKLAQEYARVEMLKIDLEAAARRKPVEGDADELHKEARWQRTTACPSEIKDVLKLIFGPRYSEVSVEKFGGAENPGSARSA